ncbi:MAG: rhodanese-like domain-containing protein [Thermoplasmatota archaeon]
MAMANVRYKSRVLEIPGPQSADAKAHFASKLGLETDPADVHFDLENAPGSFILLDCRSPESFAKGHLPGAVNLPYRTIDAATTARFPKEKLIVAYCSSVSCNASTKGALRLATLGFAVKEMVDGVHGWTAAGYPLTSG